MLNITHHWKSENQNHNEVSPHTAQNDYFTKRYDNNLGVATGEKWRKGNLCARLEGT